MKTSLITFVVSMIFFILGLCLGMHIGAKIQEEKQCRFKIIEI